MSDRDRNSGRPEDEPRRRSPREDLGDQLKRIRDEAIGDLSKSLNMPKRDGAHSRRGRPWSSDERRSSQSANLSGDVEEGASARASDTAKPSDPGQGPVQVSGGVLHRHRQKRLAPTYAPASDAEELMDAKDAGQYHKAATAGGMSESANGAMGLDGVRRIYYELGQQAATADDPKGEVKDYYPQADPTQVEKKMVGQATTGMKLLKEAYKDGYTGRPFQSTADQLNQQQKQSKGATAKPSGIVGGLLNRFRGAPSADPAPTNIAGVRGSQTDDPDVAYARTLFHDGQLCDEDIDAILSLLDSSDPDDSERLRRIIAKYRDDRIGPD